MNDRQWRLNGVFGCYLGLSDLVANAKNNDLPVYWEHIEKRLMELRQEHDRISEETTWN